MKVNKIWGTTERIGARIGLTVDNLCILPSGYCSEHRHAAKDNIFIVSRGELTVLIWFHGDKGPEEYTIKAGKMLIVEAGLWHMFRSASGCEVCEICIIRSGVPADAVDKDIERRTHGGCPGHDA